MPTHSVATHNPVRPARNRGVLLGSAGAAGLVCAGIVLAGGSAAADNPSSALPTTSTAYGVSATGAQAIAAQPIVTSDGAVTTRSGDVVNPIVQATDVSVSAGAGMAKASVGNLTVGFAKPYPLGAVSASCTDGHTTASRSGTQQVTPTVEVTYGVALGDGRIAGARVIIYGGGGGAANISNAAGNHATAQHVGTGGGGRPVAEEVLAAVAECGHTAPPSSTPPSTPPTSAPPSTPPTTVPPAPSSNTSPSGPPATGSASGRSGHRSIGPAPAPTPVASPFHSITG